ncbi:hypothetical protein OS493_035687 [Desmophyllum pertusum]|uniref:Uncharacterized protein n=1 Tax=Desmophyllum pertusum TaxID=174260 RepID=A0A9W9YUY9_9CNID|nr:hypothetical protein OS493_035687 [Desmophyllum pertusum]
MNHTGYQVDYSTYIDDIDEPLYDEYCQLFGKNDSNYIFKNPPYGLKKGSVFGLLVTTTPYKKKKNQPKHQGLRVVLTPTQKPDKEQITPEITVQTTTETSALGGGVEGVTTSSSREGENKFAECRLPAD